MEYDDYVPISGLQHLVFCPRQAALIHVEQTWSDDAATTAGTLLHERVDDPGKQRREGGIVIARALPLVSERLGLRGRADMVELHPEPGAPRGLRPVPVEMKRGKLKYQRADQVQLCAQAICLEEMFGVGVPAAFLSYEGSHRRVEIAIDDELREETARAAVALRDLIAKGIVPPAVFEAKKCSRCSLLERCLPRVTEERDGSVRALERLLLEVK